MTPRIVPVDPSFLPTGFRCCGIRCGIKISATARDLALFVSDQNACAAGTFTTNRVVAAPVVLCRERVPAPDIRAVLVNSGNANACTGPAGLEDAATMAHRTAVRLGCRPEQVLVCSTGVIGVRLPLDTVLRGIEQATKELGSTAEHWTNAAHAILTTDTTTKVAARSLEAGGKSCRILAIAKGAGMIAPRMATMLAFLFTDAVVDNPVWLAEVLRRTVDRTFNCLSVDGHTSTNDSVLLLANGASRCRPDAETLEQKLGEVCEELARAIAADGEGARHLVVIRVEGAASFEDARAIARAIADSPLVKTAVYGADPNWGRIISAAGYSGAPFDERTTSLWINDTLVYRNGQPAAFDRSELSKQMKAAREVVLRLTVGTGPAGCLFWSCDLTEEYVRFNASYTT